jgi:adenylate kinase
VERISGRRVCSKCGANYHIKYIPPKISNVCDLCGGLLITRTDDNKTSILQRLAVYEKDTTELISYYKEQNLLREISADGNPDEIANSIESLWHQ